MKKIVVQLKQNELNQYYLILPEDLLIDLEWYDKTQVEIRLESDNSVTLTEIVNKKEKLEEKVFDL